MGVNDFLKNKLCSYLKFEPTPCQDMLMEVLSNFVMDDTHSTPILIINGYAGTGKTTSMGAFIKLLQELRTKYILLAPTGRSAKVLANYTKVPAKTIHKQIYRQKSLKDDIAQFDLNVNKSSNTIFIVDEASLITNGMNGGGSLFGSGDVLDDLITFISSNIGNKLILLGDPAQLPPIGLDKSPALDCDYISRYGNVNSITLKSVIRQAKESGILYNATNLRYSIENNNNDKLLFETNEFDDFHRINGGDLIESLQTSIDNYGLDEVVILCRSNNRANRYNKGIRERILYKEEQLARGDKLMIVKNCYQFLENIPELDFIANGDIADLINIEGYEERYGLHFANATLAFPDYNNIEIDAKIILDTLDSSNPSLSGDEQRALFLQVLEDYKHIKIKKKRMQAIREDKYFNALQIKYATAITGHKSQGGQWKCVYIDNPIWNNEITLDDKKWLYTAITRGVEDVFLVNFKDDFFNKNI